jgi:hypothetical protein
MNKKKDTILMIFLNHLGFKNIEYLLKQRNMIKINYFVDSYKLQN